jgi:hypothetical protein
LLSWKALIVYAVAELLAGVLAGLVGWGMGGTLVPGVGKPMGMIFLAELIGTFGLAFVALVFIAY